MALEAYQTDRAHPGWVSMANEVNLENGKARFPRVRSAIKNLSLTTRETDLKCRNVLGGIGGVLALTFIGLFIGLCFEENQTDAFAGATLGVEAAMGLFFIAAYFFQINLDNEKTFREDPNTPVEGGIPLQNLTQSAEALARHAGVRGFQQNPYDA